MGSWDDKVSRAERIAAGSRQHVSSLPQPSSAPVPQYPATLTARHPRSILEVRDLVVHYHTSRGAVQAVNGVSFDIREGARLGLVGESGSGKSTIALALLRLIRPPGRIEGGEMLLDGVDLLSLYEEEMRRGRPLVNTASPPPR